MVTHKECNDWLYKLQLMGHILPWEIYRFTQAEKNTPVHCACINFGKCIYFNQVNNNSTRSLQKKIFTVEANFTVVKRAQCKQSYIGVKTKA